MRAQLSLLLDFDMWPTVAATLPVSQIPVADESHDVRGEEWGQRTAEKERKPRKLNLLCKMVFKVRPAAKVNMPFGQF